MRTLISHKPHINAVRLGLLMDTQLQLVYHMANFPGDPAPLCAKLTKSAERLQDGTRPKSDHNRLLTEEAFNLRAYLAQELADGHSTPGTRNMYAYLFHAGLIDRHHAAVPANLITANLARQAWVDRMIDTLKGIQP